MKIKLFAAFALGVLTGISVTRAAGKHSGPAIRADAAPGDNELEKQRAFEQMMRYDADTAYGVKEAEA